MTHYLAVRSAFFPVVGAFRQMSHRFSSLTVNSLGFRPRRDAPGTVSSVQAGEVACLDPSPSALVGRFGLACEIGGEAEQNWAIVE